MSTTEKFKYLGPVLAIVAAAAGVSLSPNDVGIFAETTTPLFLLVATGILLLVMFGGPLLLLASGLHVMATSLSNRRWFLVSFTALLAIVGLALLGGRLRLVTEGLLLDWIAMSLVVVLIAAALRHTWLWAVVGGIWTGVLLGLMAPLDTYTLLSLAYHGRQWPLSLLGCILALAAAAVAFANRKQAY